MTSEDTSLGKAEWELSWQSGVWLEHWRKPQVQAEVEQYWMRHRHLAEISKLVSQEKRSKALDVGCGISSVLHFTGGGIGVDPLAHRYVKLYEYPFPVVTAKGEHLPFADSTFDIGYCSNCIDHVETPSRLLQELWRVLQNRALLVLTCEVFDFAPRERDPGHPFSFSSAELRALALSAGFEVEHEWTSPWFGLRRYVLGEPPTQQNELILLLRRADVTEDGRPSAQNVSCEKDVDEHASRNTSTAIVRPSWTTN